MASDVEAALTQHQRVLHAGPNRLRSPWVWQLWRLVACVKYKATHASGLAITHPRVGKAVIVMPDNTLAAPGDAFGTPPR